MFEKAVEAFWLIPALPLAGCLVLALAGRALSRRLAAIVGVGSVAASAAVAIVVAASFAASFPASYQGSHSISRTLWTWMQVGSFAPGISLYLDPLAIVMVLVVSVVSFLILLYSTEFMAGEEGYRRFFCYMDLFVGSMLTLVLAENLLLLYLGWEGVGLCSFLLIGFWYKDAASGRAARKVFIVTRVGDAAMLVGLLLLFTNLGTLSIPGVMREAVVQWRYHAEMTPLATAAAALLLAGAIGKSAQLPLQTWLPDAMAGPTPVSALIHAATMVTAGVYLIARTNVLFVLAPYVLALVGVIGAVTLVVAGFSATVQTDLKRVLAYSTISQVGYMFLALGVGAWSAGIFHFVTHAFFKSLLFLAAGVVIVALDHEQDMTKMGGLRKRMPLAFWTFFIAAASLSAVPLTAGFFSKDQILAQAWEEHRALWALGIVGALLTSIYSFRMLFLVFFGQEKQTVNSRPGLAVGVPLVVLAAASLFGGWVNARGTPVNWPLLSDFLQRVFPAAAPAEGGLAQALQWFAATVSLAGVYVAYLMFLRYPKSAEALVRRAAGARLHRFLLAGCGFDWVYDRLLVRPFVAVATFCRGDLLDATVEVAAWLSRALNYALSLTQNGRLRWYVAGVVVGAIVLIAIVVLT